ncbi:MAG TPA: DNA mismatch repair protein MutS [bacterium]|nr:DNA mismatch repair protein MutS [bacterium]
MENLTPMLKQYHEIKKKYRDCILFFRLGDFYEMFFEDAKKASGILDLVLTSRDAGKSGKIPMCGIPFHAADSYIARLIKHGYKVAICEQTKDPSKAKGIVKREVIRVITSGTYLDDTAETRCLLSVVCDHSKMGIAIIDNAKGNIKANEYYDIENFSNILTRMPVYEIIYPEANEKEISDLLKKTAGKLRNFTLTGLEDWKFHYETAMRNLCQHFKIHSLAGTGIGDKILAIRAAGALLQYITEMSKSSLQHIDKISLYDDSEYVYISPSAIRGLEIESLIKTIDRTQTSGGKRLLREWLMHPLKDVEKIDERLLAVTILKDHPKIQENLINIFKQVYDIEKSLSRLSSGYSNPKDLLAIKNTLAIIPGLKKILEPIASLSKFFVIDDIEKLRDFLEKSINDDIPLSNPEGQIIKSGFNEELDSYRIIKETSNQWLKNYQSEEIKKTGISSLKIGYTQVFGYYIEISKANLHLVPHDYIRKQTLVNAERFITPQLKEFEEKMLSAQQKILEIESMLIKQVIETILEYSNEIHKLASSIAEMDVLNSFSILANSLDYTKPEITYEDEIVIKDGRHPLVETFLEGDFIPNDTLVDCNNNRLLIITGPNMAGKSTYIRQVALLVIMAQSGSYIPASGAKIGVVDKVFARIGAHDEIAKGQSTFMVEMSETASILNNLSERSLVILDEIGRGTSTYDGLALAWAVAEYLYQHRVRTLFATHFHQLIELARTHPCVRNYNVAVKQWQDEIIFLHKIVPGGTDQSYGIYVAKLAGVPESVIKRSGEILRELESVEKFPISDKGTEQLSLFINQPDPVGEKLKSELLEINPDHITPSEALNKIYQWKKMIEKRDSNG